MSTLKDTYSSNNCEFICYIIPRKRYQGNVKSDTYQTNALSYNTFTQNIKPAAQGRVTMNLDSAVHLFAAKPQKGG